MTFNKNQKTHIILLPDIVKLCFVIIDIASSLLRIVDIDCRSTRGSLFGFAFSTAKVLRMWSKSQTQMILPS